MFISNPPEKTMTRRTEKMSHRLILKTLAICFLFTTSFTTVGWSLDYSDFPPDLQEILDERLSQMTDDRPVCVTGRVEFSDGTPITGPQDVQVNLREGIDDPLRVYEGGWFIMNSLLSNKYVGPRNFIFRAFGYDPLDQTIEALDGEITFTPVITLEKTPPDRHITVSGTVHDENDELVEGARVSVRFPMSSFGIRASCRKLTETDTKGGFSISGLSNAEMSVVASKEGYIYHSERIPPSNELIRQVDLKLLPLMKAIVIEYVYQRDGSRDFVNGDIQSGTLEWDPKMGAIRFSEGRTREGREPIYNGDLSLVQRRDVLEFITRYSTPGFMDFGAYDFDSITEAPELGYERIPKPCIQGHVYIVRTRKDGHYAKFVVRSGGMESYPTRIPPPKPTIAAAVSQSGKPGDEVDPVFTTKSGPLDYSDFPPDLQEILDERITELTVDYPVCVAGRIQFIDGTPITGPQDVQVNLRERIDKPLSVYEGGWFINRHAMRKEYVGPRNFVFRAFGYDPLDQTIEALDGEITFTPVITLNKTPPDKLITISGIVYDASDERVEGAHVRVGFPMANFGVSGSCSKRQVTDSDGGFSFTDLSNTEMSLTASKDGFTYHSVRISPSTELNREIDLKLFPLKESIVIEYVYQSDGSRDFVHGDIVSGTLEWEPKMGAVRFAEGRTREGVEPIYNGDLALVEDQKGLMFRNFYSTLGFLQMGSYHFESVIEAPERGYDTRPMPCINGSVYVVRTQKDDHYAKFIVRSGGMGPSPVIPIPQPTSPQVVSQTGTRERNVVPAPTMTMDERLAAGGRKRISLAAFILTALMVFIFFVVFFGGLLFFVMYPYLKGNFSGIRISLLEVVGIRLRGLSPNLVIEAMRILKKNGTPYKMIQMVECYMAYKTKIYDGNTLARYVPGYYKREEEQSENL